MCQPRDTCQEASGRRKLFSCLLRTRRWGHRHRQMDSCARCGSQRCTRCRCRRSRCCTPYSRTLGDCKGRRRTFRPNDQLIRTDLSGSVLLLVVPTCARPYLLHTRLQGRVGRRKGPSGICGSQRRTRCRCRSSRCTPNSPSGKESSQKFRCPLNGQNAGLSGSVLLTCVFQMD